jgi:hypothetical protein
MGYQQLPVTHIEETALIDGCPSVAMILSAVASLAGSRETCIPTWEINCRAFEDAIYGFCA